MGGVPVFWFGVLPSNVSVALQPPPARTRLRSNVGRALAARSRSERELTPERGASPRPTDRSSFFRDTRRCRWSRCTPRCARPLPRGTGCRSPSESSTSGASARSRWSEGELARAVGHARAHELVVRHIEEPVLAVEVLEHAPRSASSSISPLRGTTTKPAADPGVRERRRHDGPRAAVRHRG